MLRILGRVGLGRVGLARRGARRGVNLLTKLVFEGLASVLLGLFGNVGIVDGGLQASLSVRSVFHIWRIVYSAL